MKTRWIIQDWTGKTCFDGKEFKTFEDGWEFLYRKFEHLSGKELEDELGEYYVEQKGDLK